MGNTVSTGSVGSAEPAGAGRQQSATIGRDWLVGFAGVTRVEFGALNRQLRVVGLAPDSITGSGARTPSGSTRCASALHRHAVDFEGRRRTAKR